MKTSAQELFLQANQCYIKKEFKDAENLYKKVPQKSAAVWYNMGNCAYKNGKDFEALLYWKRAKKIGNSQIRSDSSYNITLVSKKLNIPQPSHVLQNVPVLALQILFFCTFSVFLVINRKLWRAKRFALMVCLSIFIGGMGALTFAVYQGNTNRIALIVQDESIVYAGPNTKYHEVAPIEKGSEVAFLAKKDGWTKISWSGNTGWIQESNIELI